MGWKTLTLDKAFWFQEGPGVRKWQFRDAGVKLLNVSNIIKNGEINLSKTERCLDPAEANGKYKHFLVDAGDLVIASSGISIDDDGLLRTRGSVILREHLPLCMNTSTIRFKAIDGISDLSFLRHWLQSTEFRKQITREVTGIAQKNFGPSHLAKILIALPPLPEQKRIAAILDKADAIRRKREKAIELTDSFLRSVFFEMFGDLKENSKGWDRCTIGDLIRLKSGESMSATSRSAHGTIPVYGGNGITGFHNEATHNQPTLVIGRVGVYCGCVHLTEPQAWITDNALAVSILSDRVLQDFLFWGLKLANLNQYASQSAQPLVSGGRIYPVKFFLPPLDLQRRFSVIVKNFSNLQDKVGISLQTIKSLEVSLTSQLFSLKGSKSQFSSKQEVAHAL